MEAVEFFSRYDQETVEKCIQHMYYVHMNAQDTVFEIGIDS